ncbi:MAG: hypothetical protein JSR36_09905 [Proteobacteria bacterium]|nr:hypothetical protein [Pseudomonadota bacterium]
MMRLRALQPSRPYAAALACVIGCCARLAGADSLTIETGDAPLVARTAAEDSNVGPEGAGEVQGIATVRPEYGPPGEPEGVPSEATLEAEHAVIGEVIIDNQDIFNTNDPKDDTALFRLADRLHVTTRPRVVRKQLLFKPGDPYSARLIRESERILRANSYFYDAWIRIVSYKDGKVNLRVTTRDVWTLDPGINFGRSGGQNSTGIKLEDANLLGSGVALNFAHTKDVDRTSDSIELRDTHAFDGWTNVDLNYANLSDGHLRAFEVTRPFYALDTRWSGSVSALDSLQIDPIYDRGEEIDRFQDHHRLLQSYYGWSRGLQGNWVQRWTVGATYDDHLFDPATDASGSTILLPEDRRFVYPFIEYDVVQNQYLTLWNHDQIARTEDFQTGLTAGLRLGYAPTALSSTSNAIIIQSSIARGFYSGGSSTLLLYGDFSGRIEEGTLHNGIADFSARYYKEQSKNWLFFSTLAGTKGWSLDRDNQILLGGDNGLRGYPLRYQSGDARALLTLEQRYFTDWYPFRLFRVGGAIFFDMGRTWGSAPLAQPSLGLLKDVGLGLRLGNARSGLGNVIHVDLAFPLDGDQSIQKVQFLVQTELRF